MSRSNTEYNSYPIRFQQHILIFPVTLSPLLYIYLLASAEHYMLKKVCEIVDVVDMNCWRINWIKETVGQKA